MARIFVLLALFLFSVSCSRSVNTEANLSFHFKNVSSGPSASASSGYYPSKVIINVKFDGQNHFQEWNCPQSHNNGNIASCTLPTSIPISRSFPAGSNRLVQVLLVYENETEQLEFFYSDKTLSFSGGVANVVVGDTGWEHNASPSQTRVQGRLASGSVNIDNLSGRVIGYYQPQNASKPPMAVIQETVFAGWFDFMFLSNVKFTYIHKDSGRVLFNSKNAGDIAIAASETNSQVLKVRVPAHRVVDTYIERATYAPILINSTWATSIAGLDFLQDDMITISNGAHYMYRDTGVDILNMVFSYAINPYSLEITFDTGSTLVDEDLDIADETATTFTTVLMSAGVDSVNAVAYSGFGNATDGKTQLRLALPDVSGVKVTEIAVSKMLHKENYVPEQFTYIGFYNIDTQVFKPDNSTSSGVNYSSTTGHFYDGNSQTTIALRTTGNSITFPNGTWEDKVNDLALSSNFIYYEEGESDVGYNYWLAKVPTTLPSSCYSGVSADCIYVNHEKFRGDRLLEIDGPMKYPMTFGSCEDDYPTIPCTVHYGLVPGFTASLQFFKLPAAIHLEESEDFDCKAMESAGYSVGTIETSGNEVGSAVTYNNIMAEKIYYCPFVTVAGEKKYLGWGKKVYYR